MGKGKKKLVLIDSNALIHRAFHALPPLSRKDGTPTGALYGYALTLLSVMDELKPDYIAATFDLPGPTFRHKAYKEYKATRKKAPDELYEQIPLVKQMLKAYNIPIYEKKGFEADDIIGTLTKEPSLEKKVDSVVVTGDLDTLQLVDEDTSVFTLRRGIKDTVLYDEKAVRQRFGLKPEQIVDFKALRGDASDNIPGVKGVGEKTATDLLKKYKTIDGVYENIAKIEPESLQKKLREGEKDARISYELARIVTDIDVDFELEKTGSENLNKSELAEFFNKMEFYSLSKRLGGAKKEAKPGRNQEKIKLEIAKNKNDAKRIADEIENNGEFAYSILASSGKIFQASLLGIGVATSGEKGYFISADNAGLLEKIFTDRKIKKTGFNVKFDLEVMWKHWVANGDNEKLANGLYGSAADSYRNFLDVQLAAYLLGTTRASDLEGMVFEQYGVELEHAATKSGQSNLLSDNEENRQNFAAERAAWLFSLATEYQKKIRKTSKEQQDNSNAKNTLGALFEDCEIPVSKILAKMEIAGIMVETGALEDVSKAADEKIKKLEKKIYGLAKEEFNINSPSQLSKILFEKLGIPTDDIRRGKTGFSTDADQLRKIRDLHEIIPLIENYREIFKIKTTYADALPHLVQEDGRIHADFNQAVAATGRLSSSDPNMQNIPKHGKLAELIRGAFVSEKGSIFVSADYSQIDLRVAAHLSGDPKLIEAFEKKQDIHRATASWVNGIPPQEVSGQQRSEAKSLNFGILYGMGQYGFMRDSGVTRERARQFIEQYNKTFSDLKQFIEKTKEFARQKGYVETELGRRRYIQNINASNSQLRTAAERVAVNLPIQGLAADIMKLAMVEVEKLLKEYNKKELAAKLILQIHDELVFEIKDGQEVEFMEKVKKIMENVYQIRVPLTVEVSSGRNWKEL